VVGVLGGGGVGGASPPSREQQLRGSFGEGRSGDKRRGNAASAYIARAHAAAKALTSVGRASGSGSADRGLGRSQSAGTAREQQHVGAQTDADAPGPSSHPHQHHHHHHHQPSPPPQQQVQQAPQQQASTAAGGSSMLPPVQPPPGRQHARHRSLGSLGEGFKLTAADQIRMTAASLKGDCSSDGGAPPVLGRASVQAAKRSAAIRDVPSAAAASPLPGALPGPAIHKRSGSWSVHG
jgi:hypothetical protein